jgi:hypothetical protein
MSDLTFPLFGLLAAGGANRPARCEQASVAFLPLFTCRDAAADYLAAWTGPPPIVAELPTPAVLLYFLDGCDPHARDVLLDPSPAAPWPAAAFPRRQFARAVRDLRPCRV